MNGGATKNKSALGYYLCARITSIRNRYGNYHGELSRDRREGRFYWSCGRIIFKKNLDPKNHILPFSRNNQQPILHYLFSHKWFTYLSERTAEHQGRCGSKSCALLHQGSLIKLYLAYIYSSANGSSNLAETFF
jgi:hypothetical protein